MKLNKYDWICAIVSTTIICLTMFIGYYTPDNWLKWHLIRQIGRFRMAKELITISKREYEGMKETIELLQKKHNVKDLIKSLMKWWLTIRQYCREKITINEIEKFIERLKGYGCGYHKQLEKQMLNIIKNLGCKKWTKMQGILIKTDTIEQTNETIKEADRKIKFNNNELELNKKQLELNKEELGL